MKYGSVCSGIEAASIAWEPLGWTPAWFAEIEPFPAAVLAHHWPQVENLGDMTAIRDRINSAEIEAPNVLVGGTPCQAFSVAGLRNSLDDDRGQLTLEFVRLANAIDSRRAAAGLDRAVIVWENVPGVLNTKDNAFGCFLGALAGEGSELKPAGNKWTNAGCVYGPQRAIAWRVLDAQYFGVAQRRRRVFVVASARADFDPAAVLFESEGVRRDSAPSRNAGQGVAPDIAPSLTASGRGVERIGESRGQDPVVAVPILEPGARTGKSTTNIRAGMGIGVDGDPMYTLQAGKQHGIAYGFSSSGAGFWREGVGPLRARQQDSHESLITMAHGQGGAEIAFNRGPTLTCNHEAPIVCHGTQDPCVSDKAFTLGRNSGQENAVMAFNPVQEGMGISDIAPPIGASNGGGNQGAISNGVQVRRLTPTECERLQGFPDNHTQIPWRNKPADQCPDGPRYKACGNSMAVPVMHWMGKRIDAATNGEKIDCGCGYRFPAELGIHGCPNCEGEEAA